MAKRLLGRYERRGGNNLLDKGDFGEPKIGKKGGKGNYRSKGNTGGHIFFNTRGVSRDEEGLTEEFLD